MGGAEKILSKGKKLIAQGKYLEAIEILNKLVYAEPQNQNAKNSLADAFEQVGYQQESTGVRNVFLQELMSYVQDCLAVYRPEQPHRMS